MPRRRDLDRKSDWWDLPGCSCRWSLGRRLAADRCTRQGDETVGWQPQHPLFDSAAIFQAEPLIYPQSPIHLACKRDRHEVQLQCNAPRLSPHVSNGKDFGTFDLVSYPPLGDPDDASRSDLGIALLLPYLRLTSPGAKAEAGTGSYW